MTLRSRKKFNFQSRSNDADKHEKYIHQHSLYEQIIQIINIFTVHQQNNKSNTISRMQSVDQFMIELMEMMNRSIIINQQQL
jgi:hypothetical protein